MANDLLIKINADAKNAKKAFDDVKDQTEDLEDQLKGVALVSAAAFAALTAEVFLSVRAFEASDKATRTLSQALQNQGIFTQQLVKDYRKYASAVQDATGLDDDAVVSAQAVAQGYLGQTKITEELTFAIADLAETMNGDLRGAADLIGKSIGSSTNALGRYGLQLNTTDTEAQKLAKTIDFINTKAGGLAAAANKGVGGIRGLSNAFGDFQEQIGARFAPLIAKAIELGTTLFKTLANSPVIADLAAAFLAAGIAVTGLITVVALAVPAFTALKAAVVAFGIASNAALLGIPLLIGAIVAGVTLLALNWDKAMAALSAAAKGAVTLISELFSGLGKILSGALNLDGSQIKAGLAQIRDSFKKTGDAAAQTYQEITAAQQTEGEKQNKLAKQIADARAREKRREQQLLVEIEKQGLELLRLQNENASAELIQLKQQEIETLRAQQGEKTAVELDLLQERYERIKELQDQQQAEDEERQRVFAEIKAETKAELDARGIEVETALSQERLARIQAEAQTEADIDRKLQEEILSRRIQARNQELLDRKKYGEAYAKLNKAINSDEVQGTKNAAQELVALQQSKNATLKSIGKVAAIANITIGTAESALNIYRGFSTIPIVGPALGIAGAAAAIAFGAERIATVNSAQDGALVEGGIPGRDSVPFLLEPGELVVPRRNFNDVVGAVQNQNNGVDNTRMVELLESIDQKFSNPQQTVIQGDVLTDDTYIDALVKKLSDAFEFRNAQIVGLNA